MKEQQINVLDQGFITLVDHLGDDLTVVNSARVSFGTKKDSWDEKDNLLLEYLVMNRHDSPFRHVQLQFRLKAPEFVMRQWYKHIVGITYTEQPTVDHAWNEVSQRYKEMGEHDYHLPDSSDFRMQSSDNKQASSDEVMDRDKARDARRLTDAHCFNVHHTYKQLIKLGVAREQARMVLPLCIYTEVIWTASLQSVLNFISLRDHPHAQWEIQQYAKAIRKLVAEVAPKTMAAWDKYRS